jgi:hypothetical protein
MRVIPLTSILSHKWRGSYFHTNDWVPINVQIVTSGSRDRSVLLLIKKCGMTHVYTLDEVRPQAA